MISFLLFRRVLVSSQTSYQTSGFTNLGECFVLSSITQNSWISRVWTINFQRSGGFEKSCFERTAVKIAHKSMKGLLDCMTAPCLLYTCNKWTIALINYIYCFLVFHYSGIIMDDRCRLSAVFETHHSHNREKYMYMGSQSQRKKSCKKTFAFQNEDMLAISWLLTRFITPSTKLTTGYWMLCKP